ncbi:hypothetical protein GH714_040913 [Hevea brasiliensis]|uniref:Uncharacterized protein n=1 Tax=Hevea brasiliensis TaxID=3981 RepID=A0A6A6MGM6_HEVBR|nr:hypothetical protein GH714_040913 [Hevea brasiliensis]
MDLWVFGAAAAAAGYIAKHWQCVSRDRDSLAESGKNESPSYPFRRLTWRRKLAEDTSTSERLSDMYRLDGALEAEVSTSGYDEKLGSLEEYEHNIFSLSSLPLGFSRDENLKECEGENGLSGDNCGSPCTGEMDSFHDSTRKRNSLRTKHLYRHIIKPLSSLESCLMAQLYKEHINMEEYVLSVFPSSSTTTRPLLVTNGNQTIDRVNGHSFSAQISTDDNRLHKEENLCRPCGVPPLPKISALDVPNKIKSKIGKGHDERYSDSHKAGSGRHFNSQNGTLLTSLMFCCLPVQVLNVVQLDPNFVADIAQGELRADMVNGQAVNQLESDRDASGTSTSHTGNYTVSPRELSLRLHEVIQSRLEERVKKLEMALKSSERKLQLWESEHRNVWRKFPNSELRYSSGEEIEEDFNSMTTQPLVMNLSGEALDAYNEAYEELMKINESQEDDLLSGVYENNHQGGIHPFDESNLRGQNGATNSSLIHLTRNREKPSRELHFNQLKASVERGSENQELLYDAASEDENSDCSDEIEKQLIKHVVEKTRKGSPVVLNAQRLLFSMDENEV